MVSYSLSPGIRFNDCSFSEPVPLDGWAPPQFAGIYAILTADPNWAPRPFQALCFGEFGNATPADAFFRECAALVKGPSRRTLFVAVLPMPFSTTGQRCTICQDLMRGYHPASQPETPAPVRRPIGFLPHTENLA